MALYKAKDANLRSVSADLESLGAMVSYLQIVKVGSSLLIVCRFAFHCSTMNSPRSTKDAPNTNEFCTPRFSIVAPSDLPAAWILAGPLAA